MPMAWPLVSPGCRKLSLGFSAAVPASVWDINSTSGHCFFGGHSELSTHSSIPVATPAPANFDYNSTTVTTVKVFGSPDVLSCLPVYYHAVFMLAFVRCVILLSLQKTHKKNPLRLSLIRH